jgi:hypothetical protein
MRTLPYLLWVGLRLCERPILGPESNIQTYYGLKSAHG